MNLEHAEEIMRGSWEYRSVGEREKTRSAANAYPIDEYTNENITLCNTSIHRCIYRASVRKKEAHELYEQGAQREANVEEIMRES